MTEHEIMFDDEHDTLGKRLKHARETRRFTRKQLAAESGVGEKTIERYEYGTTDAKTSHVDALAEALEVSGAVLQYGPLPDLPGAARPAQYGEIGEAFVMRKVVAPTRLESTQALFEKLREMRDTGFANSPRLAVALIDDLRISFQYLEVEELAEFAASQAIEEVDELVAFDPSLPLAQTSNQGWSLYPEEEEGGLDPVSAIVERLIDLAVIGTDLFGLEFDKLKQVARNCEVSGPVFGWDNSEQIIAKLRPLLRLKALQKRDWQQLEVLG